MAQIILTKGFNDGEFTDTSNILISVDNIAVNRGFGAFDFFGVINKKAFYLDRHLQRFFHSIELMRLKIKFSKEEVQSFVESVIQKNSASDFYIKLFALPLNSDTKNNLDSALFIIPVETNYFDKDIYTHGGSLISREYSRFLPEAKSTNYLPLIFWQPDIRKSKAVDVLYYHNNLVHETSRGNIFIVRNKKVFTPLSDVLIGITRSVVIDILKESKSEFIERQITLPELFEADEVFLTSTTKKILPIVKIDEKIIGNGNVGEKTRQLMLAFQQLQKDW